MEEIEILLEKLQIQYTKIEHKAVYTVEEAKKYIVGIEGIGCKNLFLKNTNHQYYLYTLQEDKKADLKELCKITQSKNLRFASQEELWDYLKLTPGSVTPLGIIHDKGKVIVILDKELQNKTILIHPNRNTATIGISYQDLIKVIQYYKNKIIEV